MKNNSPKIIRNRCKYISDLVINGVVLDVGCVDHDLENMQKRPWLHGYLKESARSVTGIDSLSSDIESLRENGYDVHCEDATDFNLNRQFDFVVAGEIIEHLSNPGLFLDCARSHLRPAGELILSTPNANCLKYFLENLLVGRELENSDHVAIYSPKTISELLKRHGYIVKNIIYVQEDTSFYHDKAVVKLLVSVRNVAQQLFCLLRKSMAHQMIVIAAICDRPC
jgi:SAM-dependent methyltransferase